MSAGRHFWWSMTYACDNPACGAELRFLLEDGCEGPKVQQVQAIGAKGHPMAGRPVTLFLTAAGRLVVPVPMSAGRCRSCQGGTKVGLLGETSAGFLLHVRWHEDAPVDVTVDGEPDQPYFAYPSSSEFKRYRSRACGRPVFPEVRHAG